MQLKLPPELERFVADKVKAGEFDAPDDVIVGALVAMQSAEALSPDHVDELRRDVLVGIEQLDAGQVAEFTAADIKSQGRAILEARGRKTR